MMVRVPTSCAYEYKMTSELGIEKLDEWIFRAFGVRPLVRCGGRRADVSIRPGGANLPRECIADSMEVEDVMRGGRNSGNKLPG